MKLKLNLSEEISLFGLIAIVFIGQNSMAADLRGNQAKLNSILAEYYKKAATEGWSASSPESISFLQSQIGGVVKDQNAKQETKILQDLQQKYPELQSFKSLKDLTHSSQAQDALAKATPEQNAQTDAYLKAHGSPLGLKGITSTAKVYSSSGSSSGNLNEGGSAPISPVVPSNGGAPIVLDGSKVPKELSFPGIKK